MPRAISAPRGLQIERIEAFGKPAVDRSEQIAGLIPLTLVAPEPRHAHCGARFPRFCLLRARNLSARLKYRSPALVIARHWQLGLCIGLSLGRNGCEFASAILDGRILELVVLTLLVELDAVSCFCWSFLVGAVGIEPTTSPV